jgi:hypothetical protein
MDEKTFFPPVPPPPVKESKSKSKLKSSLSLSSPSAPEPLPPPPESSPPSPPPPPVEKPKASASMERYKSKRAPSAAVETATAVMKIMKISDAKDFVWVHPDEDNYWTCELCFVDVPIQGLEKRTVLHMIDEEIAMEHLEEAEIKRQRLALAAKPNGELFLCIVPSQNLDNSFNKSALEIIDKARSGWWRAISRKKEGHDDYIGKPARHNDFKPPPKWPTQDVWELLDITLAGLKIDTNDNPGLLRLIGARQNLT